MNAPQNPNRPSFHRRGTAAGVALSIALALAPPVAEASAIEVLQTFVTVSLEHEVTQRAADPPSQVSSRLDQSDVFDVFLADNPNNRAFQSLTGLNAVRVGGPFFDGAFNHYYEARATYAEAVRLPFDIPTEGVDIYLDYLLFPGVLGLDRFAREGSFAHAQVRVDVFSNDDIGPPEADMPRGVDAHARYTAGPLGTRVVTIDEPLRPEQARFGTREIDGFPLDVVELPGGFDTTYLGTYGPRGEFEFVYRLVVETSVPGFENTAIAGIGDPFALRNDANAALRAAFPGFDLSTPPFRLRAVPRTSSAVPEPKGLALLAGALLLFATARGRRKSLRASAAADAAGPNAELSPRAGPAC